MWTRKCAFVIISVRINRFPIFILFPLRCISEVIEGAQDILCLFRKVSRRAFAAITAVESGLMLIRDYGPLDFVDVDAKSTDACVKVKVLLR
jgi:hypothetical protein